jgi:hypothetical protein
MRSQRTSNFACSSSPWKEVMNLQCDGCALVDGKGSADAAARLQARAAHQTKMISLFDQTTRT